MFGACLLAALYTFGRGKNEPSIAPVTTLRTAAVTLDPRIAEAVRARGADPDLAEALMGALVTLDDTQIRARRFRRPCAWDASAGDGCFASVDITPPWFPGLATSVPIVYPTVTNTVGEWASNIHFLPRRTGTGGRSVVSVQDSNLFMTAGIAYPLFLIDDDALPDSQRVVGEVRRTAVSTIAAYKRGRAYSLWTEHPGRTSAERVVGPPNILPIVIDLLATTRGRSGFEWMWEPLVDGLDVPPSTWFRDLIDPETNPFGLDAAFNIPNDADDTAVAVAIQALSAGRIPQSPGDGDSDLPWIVVDRAALAVADGFRDLHRVKDDGRDAWRGKETGAFMTWLEDENAADVFASPESGVMPLGVNNVDCVVNANVVFAKALVGQSDAPGFRSAVELLTDAIATRAWPECGLYYPQLMMFPYAVTRAVRDGAVFDPELDSALRTLLVDLLALQREDGSIPGGLDQGSDLSTALGVVALLNLGEGRAAAIGCGDAYRSAIRGGLAYLVRRMRVSRLHNLDTFNRDARLVSPFDHGRSWRPGLFFAASYQDLGHWYSEAYTAAIVLEAVAKYLLAYDLGGVSIMDGRRLRIERFTRDADEAPELLAYRVE